MKTLTLLRHAKSGDDGLALRDFDRTLNDKGRRAARAIGARIRLLGHRFDRIVASPAQRVAETIEEAGGAFGRTVAPDWDRRLYLASCQTLLDIVRETPDEVDRLLIVAHNPGLEQLVLTLVPGPHDAMRDSVVEKYPTASVAAMTLAIDRWADAAPGCGRLDAFIRPRDLDPALGPETVA